MHTFHVSEPDDATRSTRAAVAHLAELTAERRWEEIAALLHPEAEIVLGERSGRSRRLRAEVFTRWLRRNTGDARSRRLEARTATIQVLEPGLALATGTLRVPLRRGGHVLTQATWVLVLRDGLVFRVDRRPTLAEARALARGYGASRSTDGEALDA